MEVVMGMNTFCLTQKVYPWTQQENILVRGYAFLKEDVLIKEYSFADYFSQVKTAAEFCQALKQLDGFFSVIISLPDQVLIAVDHMRSFPLFYRHRSDGDGWYISDRISLADLKNTIIDEKALFQFRHSIFTFGNATLQKGCFQLQAGEYAVLSAKASTNFWFEYAYAPSLESNPSQAMRIINRAFETSFQRTIRLLNGRTAVIPLSGGHDSRLVAYFLKKLGYKNIIAYSYGKENYFEIQRAREVAQFLDIPFYEINFPRQDVYSLYKSGMLADYIDFGGNAVSVACIQEVYPIYYLLQNKLIPRDSVFVPGHSTDFLSGSTIQGYCLSQDGHFTRERIVEDAMKRHCREGEYGDRFHCCKERYKESYERVKDMLLHQSYLDAYATSLSAFDAEEMYERIELIERESKFIENAVRVYEFFGYEWLTPEFDRTQYDCWLQISPILRYKREILYQYERAYYPEKFVQIPIAAETAPQTAKEKLLVRLSAYSVFPWTQRAHYLYNFAPMPDYAKNIYLKRNRSINYWVSQQYQKCLR